jgi:Gene product 88
VAPVQLLRRGNSDLARDGVYTWSIPALAAKTAGGMVRTCPSAGACAALCYARQGRYAFGTVKAAHTRNLETYLADPGRWVETMATELRARRFRPLGVPHSFGWEVREDFAWWQRSGGRAVRIHDAGDFFSPAYLGDWLTVAGSALDVLFYAYTKEVAAAKAARLPSNVVLIYSYGGLQDELINPEGDRHDDVFPSAEALEAAGYVDLAPSDLIAPLHPSHRIGIVANKIPATRRRQGAHTFREIQQYGWES